MEDDAEAWAILDTAGFKDDRGLIIAPSHHILTQSQAEAIDYLCSEWDYAYEGNAPCVCHPKD